MPVDFSYLDFQERPRLLSEEEKEILESQAEKTFGAISKAGNLWMAIGKVSYWQFIKDLFRTKQNKERDRTQGISALNALNRDVAATIKWQKYQREIASRIKILSIDERGKRAQQENAYRASLESRNNKTDAETCAYAGRTRYVPFKSYKAPLDKAVSSANYGGDIEIRWRAAQTLEKAADNPSIPLPLRYYAREQALQLQ